MFCQSILWELGSTLMACSNNSTSHPIEVFTSRKISKVFKIHPFGLFQCISLLIFGQDFSSLPSLSKNVTIRSSQWLLLSNFLSLFFLVKCLIILWICWNAIVHHIMWITKLFVSNYYEVCCFNPLVHRVHSKDILKQTRIWKL